MDYAEQLYKTYDLIDAEQYTAAIVEAARGIESLLYELYTNAIKRGKKHETDYIRNEFESMGGKKKGLTFGQWGRLFKHTKITQLIEQCGYQLRYINAGRLYNLTDLRNVSAHGGPGTYEPTRAEAELMRNTLELFLQDARIDVPPRPETQQPVEKPEQPQSSGRLPAWTENSTPHEDIRERRFDLGIFAIHLGEVAFGEGQTEYADPRLFFDLTYITRGLRAQLIAMLRRLSGDPKAGGIVHLHTTFGGGKTHTMLAMYHLARNCEVLCERDDVRVLTNEARVESIPKARVAVLDGSQLDPTQPRQTAEGLTLRTLWGEIAYQLGGPDLYEFVRANDESLGAPGSDTLRDMLDYLEEPVLILVDELLDYATKAGAIKVGRTYLVDQLLSFLKALTQAVDRQLGSMLVLTLTSSRQEIFGDRAAQLYDSIKRVIERVEHSEVTAESVEIYEILRRRLFQTTGDPKVHQQVAEAYWDYYRENREAFPQRASDPTYREALAASYPFHPELVDVLRDRWATIDGFQKTRGVLRLLALVVSNLYQKNHGAPLIQIGHVDLADPEIRQELLNHTDSMHGYDAAIGSDVAGKPDSKAEQIDQQIGGDYYRFGLCEGLATATFMYGHSGARGYSGATRAQLWLATLQPDVVPAMSADAFDKLEQTMWYLEEQGNIWRLGITPNLNMMLVYRIEAVRQDANVIRERIYSTLAEVTGAKFGKPVIWPQDERLVKDNANLKLVVGPLDIPWIDDDPDLNAQLYVERILDSAGSTHRQYRNTLVFVLPTADGVTNIQESAIKLIALEDIERTDRDQLTERQQEEFKRQYDAAKVGLPSAIWGAYLVTVAPNQDDIWVRWEHGIGPYRRGDSLSQRVWDRLKDEERLLERFAPDLLVMRDTERFARLWPADQEYINVDTLWDYFVRYDYLPLLAGPQVLQDTIAWGAQRGLFAYCLGNPEGYQFDTIRIDETVRSDQCVISEHAWLLDPDKARALLAPEEEVIADDEVDDVEIIDGGDVGIRESGERVTAHPTHLRIQTTLNAQNWRQFFNSVIQPLVTKGAALHISVSLSAEKNEGFEPDFIELSISESVKQIDRNAEVSSSQD